MGNDNIKIAVLADGTIKIETSRVTAGNHVNAENFLKEIARLSGGETTSTRRPDAQTHTPHEHDEHSHQH